MKRLICAALLALGYNSPSNAEPESAKAVIAPAPQESSPPSAEKLDLIHRFMKSSGLQDRIDSGSFLERYAFIPELGWTQGTENTHQNKTLIEQWTGPIDALKAAYEKYRPQYQEAYEGHINWEFTEEELRGIVNFLESPLGKHYLDGSWRMEAYTGTNMEETEEVLVTKAVELYRAR
ncbi:DUF2059 domain-containing protein [Sphingopyxis fribergensis]